jgi:hypothetical protein
MKRTTLLRYATPAVIVGMVLGFSLIIPATANEDKNAQCGYGYGYGHTDNESQQGENHESQQAENNDEPCGEVSGDEDGNHGADTSDKAENGGVQSVIASGHVGNSGGHVDGGGSKENGGGDD